MNDELERVAEAMAEIEPPDASAPIAETPSGALDPIHEEAKKRYVPEYESAMKRESASFAQLCEVVFGNRPQFVSDPVSRAVNERYIEPLMSAFEAAHGAIRSSYYCGHIMAAAVVTEADEYHVITSGREESVLALIFECEQASIDARRLLEGEDLRICIDMIYGTTTYLLDILDVPPDETPDPKATSSWLPTLRSQLQCARDYQTRAAQRRAQVDYFTGMMRGGIALGALAIVVWIVTALAPARALAPMALVATLAAGAIGAVVSVMSRMTSGRLVLNHEAGRLQLRLLGVFRPLIGCVFGLVTYVVLRSGLLPVDPPQVGDSAMYFYSTVAFIAGFSERWAQDMLAATGSAVTGGSWKTLEPCGAAEPPAVTAPPVRAPEEKRTDPSAARVPDKPDSAERDSQPHE